MRIDIIDMCRGDASLFKRLLHGEEGAGAAFVGGGQVVGVGGVAVADEFGVDGGGAGFGML